MTRPPPGRSRLIAGVALVLVVGVALLVWQVGRGGGQLDRAWQRIQADGRIRVGIDPSYPPFEQLNEETGDLAGYDVDLAREIGRRLTLGVDFVLVGFDSLYDAVQTGKVDVVISGMPYDPNWTEDVDFGMWYFNAGQFLVVRQDESAISSVRDLIHRNLGVELGTTGDLEARRLQKQVDDIHLSPYPTSTAALSALESGEIDAALVDAISAYLFIAQGGHVRMLDDAVLDESYAAVTARKSRQLRAAIDAAILEIKTDGYLDALRDKWLLEKGS